MHLILTVILWVGIGGFSVAAGALENVTATVVAEGDLNASYAFSGPLGKTLTGAVTGENAKCEAAALFRKAVYRGKKSLEAWLTFECGIQGQKKKYKPHRIYVALDQSEQKVQLPVLAEDLKSIQLIFREVSLKLGK